MRVIKLMLWLGIRNMSLLFCSFNKWGFLQNGHRQVIWQRKQTGLNMAAHTQDTLWCCVQDPRLPHLEHIFLHDRMQRNIQLLQNVHRSAEHSRHTYFLLLMLPFYLFSIIHISSPSLPSPLTSPSPPFISRYWSPSFVIVALALSFSLLLSLSNQMCSLYDLFRCKDWV